MLLAEGTTWLSAWLLGEFVGSEGRLPGGTVLAMPPGAVVLRAELGAFKLRVAHGSGVPVGLAPDPVEGAVGCPVIDLAPGAAGARVLASGATWSGRGLP